MFQVYGVGSDTTITADDEFEDHLYGYRDRTTSEEQPRYLSALALRALNTYLEKKEADEIDAAVHTRHFAILGDSRMLVLDVIVDDHKPDIDGEVSIRFTTDPCDNTRHRVVYIPDVWYVPANGVEHSQLIPVGNRLPAVMYGEQYEALVISIYRTGPFECINLNPPAPPEVFTKFSEFPPLVFSDPCSEPVLINTLRFTEAPPSPPPPDEGSSLGAELL